MDAKNAQIVEQVNSLGLTRHCRLLGVRDDVAKIYAALDIVASSSISEAFPLTVGEAMSCGVPCVVTNVGDSELMVGDNGALFRRAIRRLAAALCDLISMGADSRQRLGQQGRRRVRESFDLGAVTRRYEARLTTN